MSGTIGSVPSADTPRDFGTDSEGRCRRWQAELEKARKESNEWYDAARRINERYRDRGPGRRGVGQDYTWGMRFNIFWSNVQTLAPSLYANTPQVVVERRWGDQDDVGRLACQILQRLTQYQLEGSDFDGTMRSAVLDHLICGRGTAWVRYEPHFDRQPIGVSVLGGGQPATGVGGGLSLAGGPPVAAPPPVAPVGPSPGAPVAPPPVPPMGGAPPMGPPSAPGLPPGPPQAMPAAPPPMPPPGMMPPPGPPPGPPMGMPQGGMNPLIALHLPTAPPGHPPDGKLQIADDGEGDEGDYVAYEECLVDHVHWEDFLTSPARTWAEVRWVARQVYMTKDEGKKRFGAVFEDVPLDWLPPDIGEHEAMRPEHYLFRRARVWEIWDKPSRKVIWVAHGYSERVLDEVEDPLRLTGFFPTPKPLYATMTSESLIPVPDYQMYRDQAVQIDTLTARIEAISKSIKIAGVYDAAQEGIQRMFAEGVENQLIPVNQWGQFSEKGGLKGSLDILDIGMLSEVLGKLVEVRAQAKNDLYEVTGISDIIRGTTAASETATAQQIKAGFGTMRLRARQQEVARFARDLIRLVSEIVCEHFTGRTMLLVSDIANIAETSPTDIPLIGDAIRLLQDDKTRLLRIDVETDSTIMANHQQEQQARIQFLTMASQFLQQALPAIQQSPEVAPLLGQMMLFGIRSFPQGAELEGAFENAIKQLEQALQQKAAQPQQPPPDPKMVVAQAQVRNIDSQIQDRQIRALADAGELDQKGRAEMVRASIEKQRADDEAAAKAVESFHDREADHRDFVLEAAKLRQQAIDAERDRQVKQSMARSKAS